MTKEATTIKAVLKYVAEINTKADQAMVRDPWAQPYRINEEAAKRLVRKCAQAHVLRLHAMATPAEQAAARDLGPSDAMAILSLRVIDHEATYRRERLDSDKKDNRHRNHQKRTQRDREAQLAGLTIGQRIDRGLRALTTVSGVTAASIDSDIVTGSKDHGITTDEAGNAFVDNPAAKAKAIAEQAMRKVENEVEDAYRRRRELEEAA